ncbi:PepSY-associated TM helix domain-containing protein [Thalassomonas haliotis]|uniref:PepSY domain-containing protein n=1 Tax=Thalassomonas haliotis TaxID=485448 RepID=A0ABY7V9M8_9GAMM|nr:PepSY-associated TM helix domain-containing protein [Thalassomonas haliotis]WDE10246.1 PepSY domain-containing protein [Thalassomonas haliotis]
MKTNNKTFFKRMLGAHSGLGLAVSVLMYIICLTGTIAVFFQEFERWEQPEIAEYQRLPATAMTNAVNHFYREVDSHEKPLYIVLPTEALPRAHVSDGEHEWWLNVDGSLAEKVASHWTHLLTQLHINLHIPNNVGLVIVGILGVMLTALIISGLFAHVRILKDAFRLRWGGTGQQQQIDLHNRLSVWALPFHLVIAVTGAFFGVVGLLIFAATSLYYQGDQQALIDDVYGGDPVIAAHNNHINFEQALKNLTEIAPAAKPIYAVIQKPKTDTQYLEIAAEFSDRLIYSEVYRFDATGKYINHQGFSDGPVSRQAIYSVYRIHFGSFGGYLVKMAYIVLGLSLTVVCVTGINIWLNKRGLVNWINYAWSAFVWGVPLALTTSAISAILLTQSELFAFITTLVVALAWSLRQKHVKQINQTLIRLLLLALVLLLSTYAIVHSQYLLTSAAMIINGFIMAWFILCLGFERYYCHRLVLDEVAVEKTKVSIA